MNKVIDVLGVIFRVIVAVFLFVLVQVAVMLAFEALGISTQIYEGLFATVYGVLTVGAFVLYHMIRSYKREKLMMLGRSDVFNYIAAVVIAFGLLGFVTMYMYAVVIVSDYLAPVAQEVEEYAEHIDRFAQVEVTEVPLWDSILDFISSVLIIPLAEEMAFRGAVFGELKEKMHPVLAAVISSSIFGLLHGVSVHIVYALFCGVVLCLVYYFSGSIWVSYIVHAVFNFIGSSLFTLLESGVFGTYMDTSAMRQHASYFEVVCVLPALAAFILMIKLYMDKKSHDETPEKPAAEGEVLI